MRARMTAVFAMGFAAGMVVLAAALWTTGHLTAYRQEVTMAAPATPAAAFIPTPIPTPTGAEPVLPELHVNNDGGLAMPLANIDPRKLEGTFHQTRDGREHEALDIMA